MLFFLVDFISGDCHTDLYLFSICTLLVIQIMECFKIDLFSKNKEKVRRK